MKELNLKDFEKDEHNTSEFISNINKKKFSEQEINIFTRSVGKKLISYRLLSNKTLNPDKKEIINIFHFKIIREKELKLILKIIYSIFNLKERYLIALLESKSKFFYFSFNRKILNNDWLDKFDKKSYYIPNVKIDISDLETMFSFRNQEKVSINQVYDNIIKRYLYFFENKEYLDFDIDWEYFYLVDYSKKLDKKMKTIASKHRNSYNSEERTTLSNQHEEVVKENKKIQMKINDFLKKKK